MAIARSKISATLADTAGHREKKIENQTTDEYQLRLTIRQIPQEDPDWLRRTTKLRIGCEFSSTVQVKGCTNQVKQGNCSKTYHKAALLVPLASKAPRIVH